MDLLTDDEEDDRLRTQGIRRRRTSAKPSEISADFQLCVKRGRDGKDSTGESP